MQKTIIKIFIVILVYISIGWTLQSIDPSILGEPALALSFNGGLENAAQESGHKDLGVFGKGASAIVPGTNLILNIILSFVGVVMLILIAYGGFLWMTAGGNESQVEKAQKIIVAAIIGLLIVVSAYAVSYFVVSKFGADTLKK